MNRRMLIPLLLALLALLTVAGIALAAGGPAVDWWAIAGGGAPSHGGNITFNDTLGQPVIGPSGGGSAALSAGYWVACVAAAATMPVVVVTRDGEDVVLTWDANAANASYQVWISTNAYFDPDNPGGVTPIVTAAATYRDTGAAADLVNHFYVVRGLNACAAASANSGRTGEFTFGLTPGN